MGGRKEAKEKDIMATCENKRKERSEKKRGQKTKGKQKKGKQARK